MTQSGKRHSLWRMLLVDRLGWTALEEPERQAADLFVTELGAFLDAHEVAVSPLVALRAHDVLASLLVTLQIERVVGMTGAASGGADAKCAVPPEVEAAAKARERLRKAMKELEEACARAGTPIDQGLANDVKPMLKQAEGVADDPKNLRKPAVSKPPKKDAPCD